MSGKTQLARKLTAGSVQELNLWQETHLQQITAEGTVFKPNLNPSVQIMSSVLLRRFVLSQSRSNIIIDPPLLEPLALQPRGIKVRKPFPRDTLHYIAITFENAEEIVEQRRAMLLQHGATEKDLGYFDPLLHVATIRGPFDIDALAASVIHRPEALTFNPVQIEEVS